MGDVQKTSVNRSWLVKMMIFTAVLLGFGCWALYDAMVLYPARGRIDASFKLKSYLEEAQKAGRLQNAGVGLDDPAATLAKLESTPSRNAMDEAQHAWLKSLKAVGDLNAAGVKIVSPMEKLRELTDKFKTTTDQPVPLSWFDIPLQWIFAGIGFLGGAWILLNILRSTTKTYSWDADTKTLTLPGGKQVTTANLADVDKRKWHKFFCALQFNDGTAPVEIDLLKYANLEDWVLDLERTKFPERAVEAAAQATDQPATA